MSIVHKIVVTKENAEDSLLVRKLYFSDNDKVAANAELIDLETSKTAIILDTPVKGYVEYMVAEGQTVNVGSVIVHIHDKAFEKKSKNNTSKNSINSQQKIISKPALAYISKHNIDINQIDKNFISIADLTVTDKKPNSIHEQHKSIHQINKQSIKRTINLVGNKKLGKDLMVQSANSIPHSYVEI